MTYVNYTYLKEDLRSVYQNQLNLTDIQTSNITFRNADQYANYIMETEFSYPDTFKNLTSV